MLYSSENYMYYSGVKNSCLSKLSWQAFDYGSIMGDAVQPGNLTDRNDGDIRLPNYNFYDSMQFNNDPF